MIEDTMFGSNIYSGLFLRNTTTARILPGNSLPGFNFPPFCFRGCFGLFASVSVLSVSTWKWIKTDFLTHFVVSCPFLFSPNFFQETTHFLFSGNGIPAFFAHARNFTRKAFFLFSQPFFFSSSSSLLMTTQARWTMYLLMKLNRG